MLDSLGSVAATRHPETSIKAVARQFEGAFLSHMLAAAGAGQPADTQGGGVGESQFASFLLDAQAQRIADSGGVGLAEMIIRHYAPSHNADAP